MPARRGECGLHTDMSHALNPPRANRTGAWLPPSPLHPHLRSCPQRHQNTAVRSRSKSAKAESLRNISRNWSLGRCSHSSGSLRCPHVRLQDQTLPKCIGQNGVWATKHTHEPSGKGAGIKHTCVLNTRSQGFDLFWCCLRLASAVSDAAVSWKGVWATKGV
jgi:hypothetical protein